MMPDMDNYLVAIGTVTGVEAPGEIFHRTFTHSVFTILFLVVLFYIVSTATRDERWKNLGYGLGVGVGLHMLLDLAIWFNGVPLFWPLGTELNFWGNYSPPEALVKFLNPAELLFFGLFFYWLLQSAVKTKTNVPSQPTVRTWAYVMFALFAVFLVLAYVDVGTFTATKDLIYGLVYLVGLTAAFVLTIRMRATLEAA